MNRFQLEIIKKILELISPPSVGDIIISIIKGPNEPTIEFKFAKKKVSLWIYEDGAAVLGDGLDDRFESEDYSDLNSLMDAFLQRTKDICISLNR